MDVIRLLGLVEPYWDSALQVILLIAGLFLAFKIVSGLLRVLDNKLPSVDLKEGWIRYLLEGPKTVLVIGLISVLLGILIINTQAASDSLGIKLLGIVFTEFGFAFFIAFILHNSIEMHSRVEHDRQISRGIISYLYGVRLDDKMFNAAENYIFKSPFYRRNMRVEYEFVMINGDSVLLKHSLEYEVVNISDLERIFNIQTMVEKSAIGCVDWNAMSYQIGLHRVSIDGLALTQVELDAARADKDDDENFFQSSHALRLPAGGKALVKTVSFLEKCDRDSEFWRSLYPADGVEVRFVWPPQMDLVVKVDLIHPSGEFDRPPHTEAGLLEAKLSQPLFPYNGFLFWWSKESAAGSQG